jgi:predicted NACHT family NTPase
LPGLACWFHGLPQPRLVISGEPGTGKTTLAVLLLLDLIDHLKDDDPVPVLFTLDGWDPDVTDFSSWLACRISEDYPALRADDYGHAVADALVSQRQVLPILDGLDEIPAPLRTKVIVSLNRAMSYDDQLILTTRSAEYATAGTEISAASVIKPDPLNSEAIAVTSRRACLPIPARHGAQS